MRALGAVLILAFVIFCGLCVSGLVLTKTGVSDQMIAEFVKNEGLADGTAWSMEKQAYFYSILGVRRGAADRRVPGGSNPMKLLLIGGVPVNLTELEAAKPSPAGAQTR
jgi:hypothetical protein